MDISTIEVEERTATGRNQVARIRAEGKVPAVLYGAGRASRHLSVMERELERHVRQHHKVFKLALEGKEQAIYLQEIQWDCLSDEPLHVDFRRIDLKKPIELTVELNYLGHPKGISKGGRLAKDMIQLKIRCLPVKIPDAIDIQVGELDVGDKILARELTLPEGVTLAIPGDRLVSHLLGAELEEEVEEPEATEEIAATEAADATDETTAAAPDKDKPGKSSGRS